MKFVKNFNNNAALTKDDQDREFIVVGNGVGFGKKRGQDIDEDKIEYRYRADDEKNDELKTLTEIPSEVLVVLNQVIKNTENSLKVAFDDYQYLTLADHMDFAVKRAQQNIEMIDDVINWGISKMYPNEYQTALESLAIIKEGLNVELDKGEAVFFTYHFLNAASNNNEKIQDTIYIIELTNHIVEIVQYQYGEIIDTTSFNYSRFIAHLHMFILRHLQSDEIVTDDLDPSFSVLMQKKYPKAYETVQIIADFLEKIERWYLTPDERVYLSLHIFRVTNKTK